MTTRNAYAEWHGDLMSGEGKIRFGDGRFDEPYAADSRFKNGKATNPEELIAAAHAACFSMALAQVLAGEDHTPDDISTEARVHLEEEKDGEGYAITAVELSTEVNVSGIEDDAFQHLAEQAKENCPVSKALAGCDIRLEARRAQ